MSYNKMKKIFIHIPKNGGMSLRHDTTMKKHILLAEPRNHKSPEYTKAVLETMYKNGDHHGWQHARWRDLNPDLITTTEAFAIVRNPWARVVSRFMFAKKVIEGEKKINRFQWDGKTYVIHTGKSDYADISSFEAFLEERHKWGNKKYMWHRAVRGWYPAYDYVSDSKDNVRCDILRLEHIDEELPKYFGFEKMHLRPRNVTGYKKDYKDFYTKETIQIVADWYKKDIDFWGFDFDTSATKNTYNTWKVRAK
tara:strand:+ start:556 stop:1311 length:756 start_codon:yes stop_codon:yes gene_type:complete